MRRIDEGEEFVRERMAYLVGRNYRALLREAEGKVGGW